MKNFLPSFSLHLILALCYKVFNIDYFSNGSIDPAMKASLFFNWKKCKNLKATYHLTFNVYVDKNMVQFSCSVMYDSLRTHGLQHTRLPYPSPTPRVHSNSFPSPWWCHPTILSSVIPFSSRIWYLLLESYLCGGIFKKYSSNMVLLCFFFLISLLISFSYLNDL